MFWIILWPKVVKPYFHLKTCCIVNNNKYIPDKAVPCACSDLVISKSWPKWRTNNSWYLESVLIHAIYGPRSEHKVGFGDAYSQANMCSTLKKSCYQDCWPSLPPPFGCYHDHRFNGKFVFTPSNVCHLPPASWLTSSLISWLKAIKINIKYVYHRHKLKSVRMFLIMKYCLAG